MKNTTIKLAMFLTSCTLGMVLFLFGPGWSWGFGSAIVFAGSTLNPFPLQLFKAKMTYYAGAFISLGYGFWQFIQAERYGYVWLRVPPSRSQVAFVLVLWLLVVGAAVAKLCRGRSRSGEV